MAKKKTGLGWYIWSPHNCTVVESGPHKTAAMARGELRRMVEAGDSGNARMFVAYGYDVSQEDD
jgi:hypothetical protein